MHNELTDRFFILMKVSRYQIAIRSRKPNYRQYNDQKTKNQKKNTKNKQTNKQDKQTKQTNKQDKQTIMYKRQKN